jgi:hypothetical protein
LLSGIGKRLGYLKFGRAILVPIFSGPWRNPSIGSGAAIVAIAAKLARKAGELADFLVFAGTGLVWSSSEKNRKRRLAGDGLAQQPD